jgi:hypothetical protein
MFPTLEIPLTYIRTCLPYAKATGFVEFPSPT